MKTLNAEVGASIKDTSESPHKRGTIIGTKLSDGPSVVAVEWSDGSLSKVNLDTDDVVIVDSELERDFDEIRSKVEMAAALLGGANLVAQKHRTDLSSLRYDEDDIDLGIGELFSALRNAGWSTSSMSC